VNARAAPAVAILTRAAERRTHSIVHRRNRCSHSPAAGRRRIASGRLVQSLSRRPPRHFQRRSGRRRASPASTAGGPRRTNVVGTEQRVATAVPAVR